MLVRFFNKQTKEEVKPSSNICEFFINKNLKVVGYIVEGYDIYYVNRKNIDFEFIVESEDALDILDFINIEGKN